MTGNKTWHPNKVTFVAHGKDVMDQTIDVYVNEYRKQKVHIGRITTWTDCVIMSNGKSVSRNNIKFRAFEQTTDNWEPSSHGCSGEKNMRLFIKEMKESVSIFFRDTMSPFKGLTCMNPDCGYQGHEDNFEHTDAGTYCISCAPDYR